MPRPWPLHEPLSAPPDLVARTIGRPPRLAPPRRLADGRLLIDTAYDDRVVIARDLACPCDLTDDVCEHQLLAALAFGHPVATTVEAGHLLAPLAARTPERLDALPPAPRPSLADMSLRATAPDATDATLLDAVGPFALDWLLAYAPARRPGPVHDAAWGMFAQRLRVLRSAAAEDPSFEPPRSHPCALARLLTVTTDADLPRRLAALADPWGLGRRLLALSLTAPLAERLARTLPRPALAALLASLPAAEARAHLARALHRLPPRGR